MFGPMTAPQTFFRYVAGRFRGRLSAANDTSLTTFVLTTAVGNEPTYTKIVLGAVWGLSLYLIRIMKAVFDSTFEAIGFLLGRGLLPRHLFVRIIVGLAALTWVCFSVKHRSGWFIASCAVLFVVDLVPALGAGALGEPRLLAASVKAFMVTAVAFWAWQFSWLAAILGFLVTRRAFQFFNEGMTICAAEQSQIRRDRRTEKLFRAIKEQRGKQHPRDRIILYLRPFAITGHMKMEDGAFLEAADNAAITEEHDRNSKEWRRTTIPIVNLNIGVSEGPSLFEQGSELEATLEHAMNGGGHLIALGRPGEAIGAGRLPTLESEWRETVQLMIKEATLCIAIPSANTGTLWEIEYLVDNHHLDKCCFFMPPAIGKFSYEKEWCAARQALAAKLPLPEYDPRGGLFRLDGKNPTDPPNIESEPQSPAEMFAWCIQLLFPELPKWKVDSNSGWVRGSFEFKAATYVGRSEES